MRKQPDTSHKPIPLLDLSLQYQQIRKETDAAIRAVIESQRFINGPDVEALEIEIADYSGCGFAVGVTSGTDALLIALMALDIKPGDEVITSPYTFFATAGSIARTGAIPVFVDIDPVTFNINPSLIEEKITSETKAIMPVHLYGQCADMEPIMEIAASNGLAVIEDAAQAIGSEYKGRRAGAIGDFGCFSFFPSKNLGAFGDAGMVVTNNPEYAERLRMLRVHGSKIKYYHELIGGNFRLDSIQAAVLRVKLKYLDEWSAGRQKNAEIYNNLFRELGALANKDCKSCTPGAPDKGIVAPAESPESGISALRLEGNPFEGHRHIYNQYVIRSSDRDNLLERIRNHKIGAEIYYPVSLHEQKCFAYLGCKKGDFPESERAANETIALPIFPELTREQIEITAKVVSGL